jgi:hypothetical protein
MLLKTFPMKETLTLEQAAKIQEYNDVVNLLNTLNIDKERVLHFRASCLHTTNVAQIRKAHMFVQENGISNFDVFLHLAFSEMVILAPEADTTRGNSRQCDELQ